MGVIWIILYSDFFICITSLHLIKKNAHLRCLRLFACFPAVVCGLDKQKRDNICWCQSELFVLCGVGRAAAEQPGVEEIRGQNQGELEANQAQPPGAYYLLFLHGSD